MPPNWDHQRLFMKIRSTSKRGMTLIEVLIALVILTVGVTSMMVAMARCLSVVRTARNRETARALIRQVDIENPIDKTTIEESSDSGDFEDYPSYGWSREVEMVDPEMRPGLFFIKTRVYWAERGRETHEEIQGYKYAPNAESVTREIN